MEDQPQRIDLRAERWKRGLTLRHAAAHIKVTTRVLQAAETGSTPRDPEHAARIARFYGHEPVDVFDLRKRTAA